MLREKNKQKMRISIQLPNNEEFNKKYEFLLERFKMGQLISHLLETKYNEILQQEERNKEDGQNT